MAKSRGGKNRSDFDVVCCSRDVGGLQDYPVADERLGSANSSVNVFEQTRGVSGSGGFWKSLNCGRNTGSLCCSGAGSTIEFDSPKLKMQPKPRPMREGAAFLLDLQNLSHVSLISDVSLYERFSAEVLKFAGSEVEGLGMPGAKFDSMGSAAATQLIVQVPPSASISDVCQRLESSEWLNSALLRRVSLVPGVQAATFGDAVTSSISPVVVRSLAPFQGTWIKDESFYEIRGTWLQFPSGATSSVKPSAKGNVQGLVLNHPSGTIFRAVLESSGQVLKWSNGSLWFRATSMPLSAVRGTAGSNETKCEEGFLDKTAAEKEGDSTPTVIAADALQGGCDGDFVEATSTSPRPNELKPAEVLQRLPGYGSSAVPPALWGITARQCKELLEEVARFDETLVKAPIEDLISDVIAPRTLGTGLGYSLLRNRVKPKQVSSIVLHSEDANVETLLSTLWRSATRSDESFFVNCLSMHTAGDHVGPSLATQVGEIISSRHDGNGTNNSGLVPPTGGGLAAEIALSFLQSRVQALKHRLALRIVIYRLAVVMFSLAALLVFFPIIGWGCVPTLDYTQCGVRIHSEHLRSTGSTWNWDLRFGRDIKSFPRWAREAFKWLYAFAAFFATFAITLRFALMKWSPLAPRVLIAPGPVGRSMRGLARFGLGKASARLILLARAKGVPVEVARGLLVQRALAKGHFPGPLYEPGDQDSPTDPPETTAQPRIDVTKSRSKANGFISLEDEDDALAIVRSAATRARRSQVHTAFRWVAGLIAIRLADVALALAGDWPWREAIFCVLGSILAFAIPLYPLLRVAQHFQGLLPWSVAAGIPSLLLGLGIAGIGTLQHLDLLDVPGFRGPSPGGDQIIRILDLTSDEWARSASSTGGSCDVHCRRIVITTASVCQTFVMVGIAMFVGLLWPLLFPSITGVCTKAASVITVTVCIALVISLTRAAFLADLRGTAFGSELPRNEFLFTASVYIATQALARFAAPLCVLLRLSAMSGLQVVVPWSSRRRLRQRREVETIVACAAVLPPPAVKDECAGFAAGTVVASNQKPRQQLNFWPPAFGSPAWTAWQMLMHGKIVHTMSKPGVGVGSDGPDFDNSSKLRL